MYDDFYRLIQTVISLKRRRISLTVSLKQKLEVMELKMALVVKDKKAIFLKVRDPTV